MQSNSMNLIRMHLGSNCGMGPYRNTLREHLQINSFQILLCSSVYSYAIFLDVASGSNLHPCQTPTTGLQVDLTFNYKETNFSSWNFSRMYARSRCYVSLCPVFSSFEEVVLL